MKANDRTLEQIERQEVQNNDTMLGRYLWVLLRPTLEEIQRVMKRA